MNLISPPIVFLYHKNNPAVVLIHGARNPEKVEVGLKAAAGFSGVAGDLIWASAVLARKESRFIFSSKTSHVTDKIYIYTISEVQLVVSKSQFSSWTW